MPCSAACCRANSKCSDDVSSAFDGMQPTFTHVPPSVLSISTHTVFKPSCPARIAATYPPGPPPMITTSADPDELAMYFDDRQTTQTQIAHLHDEHGRR